MSSGCKAAVARTQRIAIGVLACALWQAAATADSAATYGGAEEKFDLVVRAEITIDRPVEKVWPRFLDMPAWMTDVRFQPVAGRPGEEGEVRLVASAHDATDSGYLIKTVRVVPFEQYAVKVTPAKGSDGFGFTDFSFSGTGGRTHLIYDLYIEFKVDEMSDEEFRRYSSDAHANARRQLDKNNQRLKALVEAKR